MYRNVTIYYRGNKLAASTFDQQKTLKNEQTNGN